MIISTLRDTLCFLAACAALCALCVVVGAMFGEIQ